MRTLKRKVLLIASVLLCLSVVIVAHKFFSKKLYAAPTLFQVVEYWAPLIEQGTEGNFDFITRFDFDGNWNGFDNTANFNSNLDKLHANVYYVVIESTLHYFITYMLYHPKDVRCPKFLAVSDAHPHDSESCRMVIKKGGSQYGRMEFLETIAHGKKYKYYNNYTSRPEIYVTPYKHAIWGQNYAQDGSEKACLKNDTPFPSADGGGIHYYYGGFAELPKSHTGISRCSYALIDIQTTLWARRSSPATFTKNVVNFTTGKFTNHHSYVDDHTRPPYYKYSCVPGHRTFGSKFSGFEIEADAPWSYGFDHTMYPYEWDIDINGWIYMVVSGEWFIDPLSYYYGKVVGRGTELCLLANGESYIFNPYIN